MLLKNTKTGEQRPLNVSGVFPYIGQLPQNALFNGILELDAGGYIKAGEDCKTNIPNIFAAGDCRTKSVRQLTTAAADGTIAAMAAFAV